MRLMVTMSFIYAFDLLLCNKFFIIFAKSRLLLMISMLYMIIHGFWDQWLLKLWACMLLELPWLFLLIVGRIFRNVFCKDRVKKDGIWACAILNLNRSMMVLRSHLLQRRLLHLSRISSAAYIPGGLLLFFNLALLGGGGVGGFDIICIFIIEAAGRSFFGGQLGATVVLVQAGRPSTTRWVLQRERNWHRRRFVVGQVGILRRELLLDHERVHEGERLGKIACFVRFIWSHCKHGGSLGDGCHFKVLMPRRVRVISEHTRCLLLKIELLQIIIIRLLRYIWGSFIHDPAMAWLVIELLLDRWLWGSCFTSTAAYSHK